jgi:hypothetical protein
MQGSLVSVSLVHCTAITFFVKSACAPGLPLEVHPASEAEATRSQIVPCIRLRTPSLCPFILSSTFAAMGFLWITHSTIEMLPVTLLAENAILEKIGSM